MGRRRRSLLGRKGKRDGGADSNSPESTEQPVEHFKVPEDLDFESTIEPAPPDADSDASPDPEAAADPIPDADSGPTPEPDSGPTPEPDSAEPEPPLPDWPAEPVSEDGFDLPDPPPIPEEPEPEEPVQWSSQPEPYVEEEPDPIPGPEQPSLGGAYSSAGMNLDDDAPSDGDFMNELYGAFGEPPPTEEVPNALYQDVSQPYNAPMNVPEPPQIPGIADRFTPPPISHTDVGSRNPDRPSYLATPTPAPEPRAKLPPPVAPPKKRNWEDDEVSQRRGVPMGWVLVAIAVFIFAVTAVGLVAFLVGTQVVGGRPDAGPSIDEHEGVEVRGNMRQTPKVFGDVEDEPPEDAEDGEDAEDAEDGEDTEDTDDTDSEEAAPAPSPPPKAAPPRPPRPAPAPSPTTKAVKGTLKIRSNRRVLVYVNGAAVGYTPQDYAVAPGDYTVSAMVPGQPGTKQTIDASVSKAGAVKAVEFSF